MAGHSHLNCIGVLSLTLAACGGGGGNGESGINSTPTAPSAPTALPNPMPAPVTNRSNENFDTTEYRNSSAAVGSNVLPAWQAGATGKGVTLGFVDTGLVQTLSDFSGRIDPQSRDVNGSRAMDDVWGHGTAIAGIAAAAHDGQGMEGIAYEATIFMAKADQGCPDNCVFPVEAVVNGIDAARMAGAKVINLSLASSASSEIRAAVERAVNAGIVIVIGAGNSGSNPSGLAMQLASFSPEQVIIVGGLGVTNPDGTINYDVPSVYTTGAGSSMASFLTAPGWLNSATYFRMDGGIDRLSGTSFATPVVTGAIGLLAQAFPMLTAKQTVLLLYMTADDLGAAGTDAVFGRGRLNIGRAFQPVGTARMASTKAAVPKSIGSLPAAAGDAARRGSLKATILDDFQRPFDMNLAANFVERAEAGPLYRSLAGGQFTSASAAMGPVSVAFTVDDSRRTLETFYLSARGENSPRLLAASATVRMTHNLTMGLGVGTHASELHDNLTHRPVANFLLSENASQRLGFGARRPLSLLLLQRVGSWRLSALAERGSIPSLKPREPGAEYALLGLQGDRLLYRGYLRLGLTHLTEGETVLGGKLDSLFGRDGSQTWFADVGVDQSIGDGWTLGASVRRGYTVMASGHFSTSAYSADISKSGIFSGGDSIAVRIAQPLRVERGSMAIVLPTSWDYKTETYTEESRRLGLSPSGRERMLEIGYLRRWASGSMSIHLFHRTEPDHIGGGPSDIGGALKANLSL